MLLGTACAILHGSALPLLMLFFGDLTNTFIFQQLSYGVAQNISQALGVDVSEISCETMFNVTIGDTVVTSITETLRAINDTRLEDAECVLGAEFIGTINTLVLTFLALAVGVFITSSMQVLTFQLAAERQTKKIRLSYYRAIMRQNIAWFDSNPTGELVNRLSE